ncbi:hypothetical protein Syun_007358 [Stephania yunnanensis]|uniref:Uncharacterized protein n=1 Tax=Stephania yunnanensis TaxID=152371 RepID=A0AAP0PYF9_9MAGN
METSSTAGNLADSHGDVFHSWKYNLLEYGSILKSVHSKGGNNDVNGEGVPNTDDKVELIDAFSKPPLPPVLGPIAVISYFDLG